MLFVYLFLFDSLLLLFGLLLFLFHFPRLLTKNESFILFEENAFPRIFSVLSFRSPSSSPLRSLSLSLAPSLFLFLFHFRFTFFLFLFLFLSK